MVQFNAFKRWHIFIALKANACFFTVLALKYRQYRLAVKSVADSTCHSFAKVSAILIAMMQKYLLFSIPVASDSDVNMPACCYRMPYTFGCVL